MTTQSITVETTVAAPVSAVWDAYITPEDIMQWNSPSDDWHTPAATVDLREGGAFSSRMEAKDGSMGFDFAGTYTKIVEHELIEYDFGDLVGRFGIRHRVGGCDGKSRLGAAVAFEIVLGSAQPFP